MAGLDPSIAAFVARGVLIPRPDLVFIDGTVDPVSVERGAEIHPGARIEGARTLIGAGSRIGTAGPVVLRNCALGRGVELASGVFEDCVFLDGVVFGPGAQARAGTLFEERARAAHTVGTKHTILLPFVTLGSLINFCDCLMAGGTSESDHGEVGSGFIHFNFTPAGDKATPSLFGDVPRGVFIREPRIFLGGHSGVVGPVRVGFGSVLAAGATFRRDCGERMLVMGEPGRADSRPIGPERIRGARVKVKKNLEFAAELAALLAFHGTVRTRLSSADPHRRALAAAAVAAIAAGVTERIRQLERFGALLARSAASADAAADSDDIEYQRGFPARFAGIRDRLAAPDCEALGAHPDKEALVRTIPRSGSDYLEWVRRLTGDEVASGVRWLEGVRARYLDAPRSAGLL